MCGVYGHEARHLEESEGLFRMSWALRLAEEKTPENVLATGYSCRSQTKRIMGETVIHPVVALARLMKQGGLKVSGKGVTSETL